MDDPRRIANREAPSLASSLHLIATWMRGLFAWLVGLLALMQEAEMEPQPGFRWKCAGPREDATLGGYEAPVRMPLLKLEPRSIASMEDCGEPWTFRERLDLDCIQFFDSEGCLIFASYGNPEKLSKIAHRIVDCVNSAAPQAMGGGAR